MRQDTEKSKVEGPRPKGPETRDQKPESRLNVSGTE